MTQVQNVVGSRPSLNMKTYQSCSHVVGQTRHKTFQIVPKTSSSSRSRSYCNRSSEQTSDIASRCDKLKTNAYSNESMNPQNLNSLIVIQIASCIQTYLGFHALPGRSQIERIGEPDFSHRAYGNGRKRNFPYLGVFRVENNLNGIPIPLRIDDTQRPTQNES